MFNELEKINSRPQPFQFYTTDVLWTDAYIAEKMLTCHLDGSIDVASRRTDFIERSAAWIIKAFDLKADKSVADFGCGPGLYTSRLAKSGAQVSGIDFSTNSIRYAESQAQQNGLPITYINENYLEFETEQRFDLITMIMCDFCVFSPAQRKNMLDKFLRFLKPGGSVLLDVYSLNAYEARQETALYEKDLMDGFWSGKPYYGFMNTFKYDDEKVVLDKYTLVEASHTRVVYNWLQYFDPHSLRAEFEHNGFIVDALYADVAGSTFRQDAPEFAISARKPQAE